MIESLFFVRNKRRRSVADRCVKEIEEMIIKQWHNYQFKYAILKTIKNRVFISLKASKTATEHIVRRSVAV